MARGGGGSGKDRQPAPAAGRENRQDSPSAATRPPGNPSILRRARSPGHTAYSPARLWACAQWLNCCALPCKTTRRRRLSISPPGAADVAGCDQECSRRKDGALASWPTCKVFLSRGAAQLDWLSEARTDRSPEPSAPAVPGRPPCPGKAYRNEEPQ